MPSIVKIPRERPVHILANFSLLCGPRDTANYKWVTTDLNQIERATCRHCLTILRTTGVIEKVKP